MKCVKNFEYFDFHIKTIITKIILKSKFERLANSYIVM